MDTQYYHVFCTSSPFQICSEASLWTKNPQVSVLLSVGAPHNLVTQNTVRCEIHTIVFYWDQIFHNYWTNYAAFGYLILLSNYADHIFSHHKNPIFFSEIGWFTHPTPPLKIPEVMPLMVGFFGIGVTVRSITRAGTRKPVFNVAGWLTTGRTVTPVTVPRMKHIQRDAHGGSIMEGSRQMVMKILKPQDIL